MKQVICRYIPFALFIYHREFRVESKQVYVLCLGGDSSSERLINVSSIILSALSLSVLSVSALLKAMSCLLSPRGGSPPCSGQQHTVISTPCDTRVMPTPTLT